MATFMSGFLRIFADFFIVHWSNIVKFASANPQETNKACGKVELKGVLGGKKVHKGNNFGVSNDNDFNDISNVTLFSEKFIFSNISPL